jgi:hypothetical protein
MSVEQVIISAIDNKVSLQVDYDLPCLLCRSAVMQA